VKTAVIMLADGFEETEAIVPIDLLRRSDINVLMCALNAIDVVGAHLICFQANLLLKDLVQPFDALILPGGLLGVQNLAKSSLVGHLLKESSSKGALIGAICAAPAVVLGPLGLLKGKKFTCYPGMESLVEEGFFCDQNVVQEDNFITSRGLGTATDFAYQLICALVSENKAQEVFHQALIPYPLVS